MSGQADGAVALVTGANRGIGREVARQLAQKGYTVLVGARDAGQGEATAAELAEETGASVSALTLDVSDPDSIAAAVARVRADPGRLDVLVNNAGIGSDFGVAGVDPDFEAALNAMTRILATELKEAGFLVNSACPGFVNTDMGGPMGATKSVEDGARGIVWLASLPDDGPTGGFFRDGQAIAF